jgi:hypothetical protein
MEQYLQQKHLFIGIQCFHSCSLENDDGSGPLKPALSIYLQLRDKRNMNTHKTWILLVKQKLKE